MAREHPHLTSRHARERTFYDTRAAASLAAPPRDAGHWEARWEAPLLDAVRPLEGLKVLDLGCGDGELAFRLLEAGAAEVVGVDIASAMVELAAERLATHRAGAPVRFVAAPVENTGLPGGSFDVVVGKWILHHADVARTASEVHRLLVPGGRAAFMETSGMNPLLAAARRLLAGRLGVERFGTADERPLSRGDIGTIRRVFPRCQIDFPQFSLFYILDRNVLGWRWERVSEACLRADAWLARRPRVGPLSYYVRIVVEREA